MADILIVAATPMEAVIPSGKYSTLVTGAGITATTYHLTKALQQQRYKLVVNIGICGTLDHHLGLGTLVHVTSDRFADFGAEDGESFLSAFELGISDPDKFPFSNGKLTPTTDFQLPEIPGLVKREGITVHSAHGSEHSYLSALKRYGPCVESMEGAACFFVCMMENTPCIQLRAISNRVERRDRKAWDIPAAINTLSGRIPFILEAIG